MTLPRKRWRRLPVAGLAAIALAALTSIAAAQPSPEQQSAIRASCRSDFMSKCSGVTPGGKDALLCLQKNVASLSPACKTAVSATIPAPAQAAPAKPAPVPAAVPPAAAAPPPPAPSPPVKSTAAPPSSCADGQSGGAEAAARSETDSSGTCRGDAAGATGGPCPTHAVAAAGRRLDP